MKFQLLKKKTIYQRIDYFIFLILYPLTLIPSCKLIYFAYDPAPPTEVTNTTFSFLTDHLNVKMLEPHTLEVMAPFALLGINILYYLLTIWSLSLHVKVNYSKATEDDATHVLFYPKPHKGKAEIVEFIRNEGGYPSAVYQQKKRELVDGKFVSLKYPKHEKISFYFESQGLTTKEAATKTEYYGKNTYSIPIPGFLELLKEHMLAPLFVFQIFSVLCFLLDSYLTYPLVTIASLILIEANTVRTRQSNLQELRGVEQEPIPIRVYRDGQWKSLTSDNLVPGDLVFISGEMICPADMLLMSGRVVVNEAMLTGESTPQVKESAESIDKDHVLMPETDKRHILFGGTRIEQVISGKAHVFTEKREGNVAYVLSTGLGSSQGDLLRTILFASDRVTAESKDSIKLLLFLTFFAIAASAYIVNFGIHNDTISSFCLIVNVIKIITSTIPPDLPMQLTFSVNASLLALSKLSVFCTEPFRIPFAGTVSVCCFDKTGTLTAEEYQLLGVDEMKDGAETNTVNDVVGKLETNPAKLSHETQMIIGGCHSLVASTNGKLIGDELEAASFSKLNFKFTSANNVKNGTVAMSIEKTYHFSAELRRMSTIVTSSNPKAQFVVSKGAPEVIAEHLAEVPENYFETYRLYTKQGCRVLALAYKKLPSIIHHPDMPRDEVESGLTFAGFTIFGAPWKKGTEDTIVSLLKSTHRVVIITGDDPLTACHVASKLHILTEEAKICDGEYDPTANCYTGKALNLMVEKGDTKALHEVVSRCNVFARTSPDNKALVVRTFKEIGLKTMMCGDGTNDVNALKTAECGIGLIENAVETKVNEDEYKPQLGAASVAAPFVSKRSTISACIDIIRFGRATLSSTIDLFKFLSLQSLISAYTSSALVIDNIKFGDTQMTLFALISTISYMTVSMAKPVRFLSKERPFDSQFNAYLVVSVLLQFAVHVFILYLTRELVFSTGYVTPPFDYKITFSPSLMNTAMYLVTNAQETTTFLTNYRGHPFMTSFFDNKPLLYSVIVGYIVLFVLAFEVSPELNKMFELVPLPSDAFKYTIAIYMVVDVIACYIIEKVVLFIFTIPKKKEAEHLVSKETLEAIENYEPHNDDVLDENCHKFNFIEMFKENFALQKNMVLKKLKNDNEQKIKQLTKKGKLTQKEKKMMQNLKEQQKRLK